MIDLDNLERLASEARWVPDLLDTNLTPMDLKARNEFRNAAKPPAVLELCAEVRRLRAYQESARKQVYELMGVVVDIEQFGSSFDEACMNTVKRVMEVLVEGK